MSISLWAFTGFLSVVLIISLLEIIFWPVYFDCNEGKITCFVLALTFFIYMSLFSKFSCFLTFPCSRKFKILKMIWLRYNLMWCKMKQIHINRNDYGFPLGRIQFILIETVHGFPLGRIQSTTLLLLAVLRNSIVC